MAARARVGFAFVVAFIAVSIVSGAGARSHAKTATFNWDFMIPAAPNPQHASMGNFEQAFADEVYKKTNGALKITLRSPGELPYTLPQTLQTIANNQVQLADGGAFIAGDNKVEYLTLLPGLITSQKQFFAVLKLLGPELSSELAKFNASLLYAYMWPPQILWGNGGQPQSVTDVKGRKIRVNGAQQAYLFDKLGATPVTLSSPDVPPALQRHVVDAATTAAFNAFPGGWTSLVSWGYLQPINITPSFIIVNKTALQQLPTSVRNTLESVAAKWQQRMAVQIPKVETLYQSAMAKAGVHIVRASASDSKTIVSIMKPYWGQWAGENGMSSQMKAVRGLLGR